MNTITTKHQGASIHTHEDGEVYIDASDDSLTWSGIRSEMNLNSRAALESLRDAIGVHPAAL